MATLKEHQAAIVDLLANGSGIPASASRLAHAMHDVLNVLASGRISTASVEQLMPNDATTPGLNDKALSKPQKALKTDSHAKRPTPAEQRVKELENTCNQLREQVKKQRKEIALLKMERNNAVAQLPGEKTCEHELRPEQAGCRKPDTQVCEHNFSSAPFCPPVCLRCGLEKTE